ncbi:MULTISPECIES: DUF2975 domain-containing protein [unclassified Solwaraspora]|uniref:DUF2975 domain-containing protein n=1 Tax=unclassified Solwaraspora TaxID=2627926 RepID=UPI00259B32EE|nr:DUF2975 domain-containing protein [Solwaraspora sp. WMMA2056]WJK41112.1 DUF2975 domain-containing protein [Solwaraspora sp. WMMA2056]
MRHDIEQGTRPRTGPAGQRAFEAVTAGAVALGTLLAVGSAIGVLVADNLVVPVTVDPTTDLGPLATAGRFALAPQGAAVLTVTEPTAADRLWIFGPALLLAAVIATSGGLLWRVVRSLRSADPFHPRNARRVGAAAAVLLLGGSLAAALQAAGHLALVSAARHAWQPDQAFTLQAVIDPPAAVLLFGLGLGAAAEFLRRGAAMRADLDGLV